MCDMQRLVITRGQPQKDRLHVVAEIQGTERLPYRPERLSAHSWLTVFENVAFQR